MPVSMVFTRPSPISVTIVLNRYETFKDQAYSSHEQGEGVPVTVHLMHWKQGGVGVEIIIFRKILSWLKKGIIVADNLSEITLLSTNFLVTWDRLFCLL